MNSETAKSKYYVYGIWNNEDGTLVTKDGKPDIIEFNDLQDAIDEVSVRVEEKNYIMWCMCKSEPRYEQTLIDGEPINNFRLR